MSISSEITVKGPAFAAAVSWVAKWAPSKPTVPIQGGIRIDEVGGVVALTAFGENVTARAILNEGSGDGSEPPQVAVVSARLLDALAGTLGKGDVAIGPGPDGTVQLTQGRAVMTLPTLPEADWPTLPGTLQPIGEVAGDALAAVVKRVGVAAGDPDTQPRAYACMRLGFGDGNSVIEVMGATREHGACATVPWIIDPDRAAGGDYAGAGDFPAEATPLAATMIEAAGAFAGPDTVEIGCDGSVLSFTSPTRSLTLRTIPLEKPWPVDTMRTIAGMQQPHAVTLDRSTAITPLKRATIVRGKSGCITLTFRPGEIGITSAAKDEPTAGDDAIDAVGYSGDDLAIGFNPQYLAEGLAAAPGDKVTATFQAANMPLILRSDDDPSWRHAVMPVRILRG